MTAAHVGLWRGEALRCGLLLLGCALVFAQVLGHGFVLFDDPAYVAANPIVRRGLTLDSLVWAFTSVEQFHWHPLTWLSHMLDVELFGISPRGHHATNVLLHAVNSLLVYLLFRRTTGAPWASALVAALFAVHPTHVESVAWVAGRKDLLAGLFGLLSLHRYVDYARTLRLRWLVSSLALLAIGLLAKSSLVVWPALFLVVDVWPLRRVVGPTHTAPVEVVVPVVGWRRACVEKVLLLAPSLLALPALVYANLAGNPTYVDRYLPTLGSVAMALDAAVFYLRSTLWPVGLHAPRSVLGTIGWWQALAALLVVVGGLSGGVRCRRRWPWLLAGWAWFLVVLLPVSGVLWAAPAARADRYTYLSTLGLYVLLAWGGRALAQRHPRARWLAYGLGVVLVFACAALAHRQAGTWRDDLALFEHAIRSDPANSFAHHNLGVALELRARDDEALAQYRRAQLLNPGLSQALLSRARLLSRLGRGGEAAEVWPLYVRRHLHELDVAEEAGRALIALDQPTAAAQCLYLVVDRAPDRVEARALLAVAQLLAGHLDAAAANFIEVLKRAPGHVEASYRLGALRAYQGRLDEALDLYRTALASDSSRPELWTDLGQALQRRGDVDSARQAFAAALLLDPSFAPALQAQRALAAAMP